MKNADRELILFLPKFKSSTLIKKKDVEWWKEKGGAHSESNFYEKRSDVE